jgi:MFS family permease
MVPEGDCLTTSIPQRLDRLPWSSWHRKMVTALGITWLLDGLEVTMAGALASILKEPGALGLSDIQVGATATAYLVGAVTGALFFGWLTDRLGRKKLFFTTLGVYVGGTAATAFAWNFWSFVVFRGITGLGIGGEYAAINSAIDELVPAAVRGTVDLSSTQHSGLAQSWARSELCSCWIPGCCRLTSDGASHSASAQCWV